MKQTPDPSDERLQDLFSAQVERCPQAIAVTDGAADVTYAELWQRASCLAGFLQGLGVEPEERVGLCIDRSADALTGMLGILQAGGAYVPLDPAYPRARLAAMLEDSGAKRVVTRQDLWAGLGLAELVNVAPVCLDSEAAAIARCRQTRDPRMLDPRTTEGHLAYVIFTSGSTGRAKGVAIEHRSAVAFLRWARTWFSPEELSGVLAATSFCFDLSIFEIFAPLSVGGRVILARDALQLPEFPAAGAVTLVNTVPSALAELLRMGRLPAGVKTVNLAGEPLRARLASAAYAAGAERLYNLYGPSEDTTYSTVALVPRDGDRPPTIGRPIDGTEAWLLAPDLSPLVGGEAGGETGELFLGGAGLARGYLGRPDLTAERFVPDPFSGRSGARLYRTGDLVRRLPDGELDFLGRADHQVKIRGFRIELGEIEAVLAAHAAVSDVAAGVVERDDVQRRLVAWVEPVPGREVEIAELRRHLRQRLPAYMVPSSFVVLAALPRLPNGKIDRATLRKLPELSGGRSGLTVPYEAPRDPLEEEIAALWEELTGVAPVGRRDPFLELGGHSLLAAQVAARLRESRGIDLPPHACLAAPTVAELAARVAAAPVSAGPGSAALGSPNRALAPSSDTPLSDAQRRLWLLDRLVPESPLYNIPEAVRLRGPLDAAALERALGWIVGRHAVLRTGFALRDHVPVQVVAARVAVPLPVGDLRVLPAACRESAARAAAEAAARAPFDLGSPPLLRAALFRLEAEDHLLVLVLHHVAADGWSLDILFRELGLAYAAQTSGADPDLQELAVQYADFSRWQLARLAHLEEDHGLQAVVERWRQRLGGEPPALDLPADRPRSAAPSWRGVTHRFDIAPAAAEALRRLARGEGATLFMACLAVFEALLSRVTGQEDFIVGTPVAGRSHPALEEMIGFFVNLLPLRADLTGGPTGRELLGRVRRQALEAYADQDVPFDRLVDELHLERDPARPPLLQAVLVLEETAVARRALPGLAASRLEIDTGTAKFDLTLYLEERPDSSLRGAVEASADLFTPETAAALAERFARLIEAFTAEPDRRVAELPVLSADERRRLLVEVEILPVDPVPVQLQIAAAAAADPERLAVVSAEESVTYGELFARASQLAHHLSRLGAGPEKLVAVLAQRSVEMVEGQLAALLSGSAFLPLDPELPAERLRFLVADSGAAVVLAQSRVLDLLPSRLPADVPLLRLDADRALWAGEPSTAPPDRSDPEGLAYVIYTSGSTGEPKGVAVRHAGLSNLASWHRRVYAIGPDSRGSSLAGLSFDAAVWELWPYLATGARVVLAPEAVRLAPSRLLEWLAAEEVSVAFLPTPLAEAVLAEAAPHPPGLALRALLTGGDVLHRGAPPGLPFALVNHYGPTENSVVATCGTVPADGQGHGLPPLPPSIGRPIDNVRVYLLDAWGQPVPPGSAGEIHLGGDGLARGYLGRPALTAERFVPDPFGPAPGGRLYRTGDLARWRGDGELQFLGRRDHQVKVRGFRIEVGEIEACLALHPVVRQAVVRAVEGPTGPRLVAWIAPETAPDAAELRDFLRRRLPAAMVPADFVRLAALPLTVNGKVDRRALVIPETTPEETLADAAAAPRGETEALLLGIWQWVLGRRSIGLRDDFFLLGGHSLLGAQVISRVQAVLGVDLPLAALFASPTVAGMAAQVEAARAAAGTGTAGMPPPAPAGLGDRAPLSLTQQGLWFLSRLEPESCVYNIPSALRLRGELDAAALALALLDIVRRHEALRTALPAVGGGGIGATFKVGEGLAPSRADGGVEPQQRFESRRPDDQGSRALPPTQEGASPSPTSRSREETKAPLAAWGEEPEQVTTAEPRLALRTADLRDLPEAERAERCAERIAAEVTLPFDLAHGPLLRALLLRTDEQEHTLVLTVHHIVADGWSMGLLHRDLAACYAARRRGEVPALTVPPLRYADFAVWQRRSAAEGWLAPQIAFWRQQLTGDLLTPLEVPADRPHPAVRSHRGATLRTLLPAALTAALRELGGREGGTLLMVMRAGFEALLFRLTGRERFVIGTPVAGRNRPELEEMIGFFVRTLPIPADLTGRPSFRDLLARVRTAALAAYDHQDVSFERLVEELRPTREEGRNPLFEVLLAGNPPFTPPALPGLETARLDVDTGTAKFDLTLFVEERAEGLELVLEADSERFEAATCRRFVDSLLVLLEGAAADPGVAVADLPLLREPDRRQLLDDWGRVENTLSCDRCVHELFEERCAADPGAVALVAAGENDETLTYGELNRRADRLARRLRRLGVGTDQPVGLCADRSFALVVGLLGILKAGGAYVPLDPSYPAERLAFMVADARLSVLVGTAEAVAGLAATGLRTVFLNDAGLDKAGLDEEPEDGGFEAADLAAERTALPHSLAYILFTSGSTGRPKGVAVPHRAVVRLVHGTSFADFSPDEVFLQYAPVSFDLSTLEVWGPLLNGARLVLPPPGRLSLEELGTVLRRHGVSFLWLTAGLFHLMVDEQLDSLRGVRQLIAGGDVLSVPHVERTLAALDSGGTFLNGTFINGYGPTENTTFTTCHALRGPAALGASVPIGRPIAGTTVVVVDPGLRLLPVGVPGELLTGGDGLARGYFGRPDLTAERFVPDPFSNVPGARLYRTGDLARWLPGGILEFLGRRDQQVKIRGFRIEPGEIETALGTHPGVRESVVVARAGGGGGKRLVAYVVPAEPDQAGAPGGAELRAFLLERLPEHMVPAAFVILGALPLSPNGKVDRAALPAPEAASDGQREAAFTAPRTPLEAVLAELWAEVLDLDPEAVGVHDDFFAAGGHSLLATRLISRILQVLRAEVPLRLLFRHPTVAGLAAALTEEPAQRARVEKIAELLAGLEDDEENGEEKSLEVEAREAQEVAP